MQYLLMSDLYTRVREEDLRVLLDAGSDLVLIDRKAQRRFVKSSAFTIEQWRAAVAKGLVYVLGGRKWYCTEHLNDDALPLLPVPFEQVFKPEVLAAPVEAVQTELQLENKPAEATTTTA